MRFPGYLLATMTLLQLILLIGIQSMLTEALENIVIMEGSEANFKCPSTSGNCNGVNWRKKLPTVITMTTISKDNNVLTTVDTGRYSVDGSSGCNLRIRKVQRQDAGLFDCEYIEAQSTMTKAAFLIVLKSNATCGARVNASAGEEAEGDGVQLTCELTFSGIEKASLTWKNLGVSFPGQSGNNLELTHSLVAARPKIPSYECVITFEIPRVIRGLAENTPLAPTCKTKEFELRYSVKTVSLSPSLSVYSPGTVITCSSDGNPSPSYKWQITDAINGQSANWRDITDKTENEITVDNATSNFYRCVASNVVRGSSYVAFSEPFQVNYTGNQALPVDGSLARIAIGVTISVLLLLIIIVVVCLYLRVFRKKANMKSKDKYNNDNDGLPLKSSPNRKTNGSNYSQAIPVASVRPQSQQQRDALKRPTDPPPPPLPRDNVPGHLQQREDLVYASIAIDEDPHKVKPKIQNEAQNSDYADITIA